MSLTTKKLTLLIPTILVVCFLSLGPALTASANNHSSSTNNGTAGDPAGETASADGKNLPQNQAPDNNDGSTSQVSTANKLGLTGVNWYVYNAMIGLGGIFVYFGGQALDISLTILVVGMGDFIRSNLITAIDELWKIIRDIFNILFIFGLIYIGFKTILGNDDTGTKKMLVSLIAAALLINFSLLFTKSVVDFSNATAYQIYGLLGTAEAEYQIIEGSSFIVKGISGSFLQISDLASYADKETKQNLSEWDFTRTFTYAFMVMSMMMMAAFVFLAGAFMMIARFVILIFCMIFSPVMFLGWVFPQFTSLASSWWKIFINNAFLAPAYLFMLFLSLKTMSTINGSGSIFEAANNGSIGVVVLFCVMMGFLYGSLVVAKKMGGAGASLSMKAAHAVRAKTQMAMGAVAIGGAAKLARGTIGRRSQELAEDEDLLERASRGGLGGWSARQELKVHRALGNASFDARNVAGVGKKAGLGEGRKGGYKTTRDEVVKKEKAFAKSLGEVGDDDPAVMEHQNDVDVHKKKIKLMKEGKDENGNDAVYSRAQIERAQNELHQAETALKQEKQRRQTGSVEYNKKRSDHKKATTEIKMVINTLETERSKDNVTAEQKAKFDSDISAKRKELSKLQSEFDEQTRKMNAGYAEVVEKSGIKSWLEGRTKDQNRQAGEDIRKEYEKKIKRTKEETLNDSLREEIGKNANKSD